MKGDYIFSTYNELNKEFEVHVMLVSKNTYEFKLVKKTNFNKPHKMTLEDLAQKIDDRFNKLEKRIDVLEKRIGALEKRLDNIVLKNNLIE